MSWQTWLFAPYLHLINSAVASPCCWSVLSLQCCCWAGTAAVSTVLCAQNALRVKMQKSWNLNAGWISLKAAGLSFPAWFLHNVLLLSCTSSWSGPAVVHTGAPASLPPPWKTAFSSPCLAPILRHECFSRWISLQLLHLWCEFFSPSSH